MRVRIKTQGLGKALSAVSLLAMFLLLSLSIGIVSQNALGVNITNVTVLARVNVTNTEPNITAIILDDGPSLPANEIDLAPNDVKTVYCNATAFDYNGGADIVSMNASIYILGVRHDAPDDNNHKYSASYCPCETQSATTARCSCSFNVQYYANYSNNWICNATVSDNGGSTREDIRTNLTDNDYTTTARTVTRLLAINTSTLLDYGNLTVTQTSSPIEHNVTNGGNTQFNLTLRGYGGTNEEEGINKTMICDLGNISVGNQRYALGSGADTTFTNMNILRNVSTNTSLLFPPRVNDSDYGWDRNSTYWRLQIPLSVGGICNGTIIFGAIETS